jgi:hypothetical protein
MAHTTATTAWGHLLRPSVSGALPLRAPVSVRFRAWARAASIFYASLSACAASGTGLVMP